MKVVIIATEASSDFLGYNLIKSLRKKKKKINLYGVGGPLMESIGFKSWIPISEFNTIGLFEVLIRIKKFLKILKKIENQIRLNEPNILITIDSPSLSYRVVKRIQDLKEKKNIKIYHYVAPTVWAWKKYRAKIFAKLYDGIFTLFRFENKYFTKYQLSTQYVGHQIFFRSKVEKKKKIICFLPGSRNIEIKCNLSKMMPSIKKSIAKFKDYDFFVLTFDHSKNLVDEMVKDLKIKVITDYKKKKKIMKTSFLAVAASGSVSLELCKYKVPSIIVYDTHFITKIILKLFVRVKFASLINIFYNREVLPEFLFERFNTENVFKKMIELIGNKNSRMNQLRMMNDFSSKMILDKKNPSEIIAKSILKD